MDAQLSARFAALARLGDNGKPVRTCKVCGGAAPFFDVVDFNKLCSPDVYHFGLSGVQVPYFQCGECDLLFTDLIDDWSGEEIARFIYNDDYVLVDPEYLGARAKRTAVEMAETLKGCEDLRLLDYGSGSGVFAEEMRKAGFRDISSYDPFSSPERPSGRFSIITCFEAVEHSPTPLPTFLDMQSLLEDDGSILVGQTLQPNNLKEIGGRWWYLAPRNGHVSTYSDRTFLAIAERLGMVYRHGVGLYGFDRPNLSETVAAAAARVGQQVSWRLVGAPEDQGDPGWHGLESAGPRRFRWTARPEVTLSRLRLKPGVAEIRVPYFIEIQENFARGCQLTCNGEVVPTQCSGSHLCGRIEVPQESWIEIGLRTPPLISPRAAHNTPDDRELGLAVLVAKTLQAAPV